MSTATATDNEFELGVPADKAFDEVAFHDPTVCSRCFCLIRRHDTFRPDADGGVSKYAPEERLIRAFRGDKGYKVEPVDEYGYRPLHEPRTFCSDCGSQSGRADVDDLPRRNAVIFADNLADRLDESGVRCDRGELKRAVGLLKSHEDLNGCDTEIFRRATKVVVRRARC